MCNIPHVGGMKIDSIKHSRSLSYSQTQASFRSCLYESSKYIKMYCKNPSFYGAMVVLLCFLLILFAEAQLNFSTGWGKRNKNLQSDSGDTSCSSQGRPSLDRLLNLYNLIQIEAQWILDCRKSSQ